MRFIDLLVLIFLIFSFSSLAFSSMKTYIKLSEKNNQIKNEAAACKFISESFKNACEGKGFESLNSWQKNCKSLWNLKYIAWCDARDFLPISNEYNKKILYGKWIGESWEGEVYWEIDK